MGEHAKGNLANGCLVRGVGFRESRFRDSGFGLWEVWVQGLVIHGLHLICGSGLVVWLVRFSTGGGGGVVYG